MIFSLVFCFLPACYAGIVFSPQGITDKRLEVSGESSCLFKPVSCFFLLFCQVKPRAKGHNFPGQQLPTLLDDTCCVGLYTLLDVVARVQSLKPVKLLSQHLPTFLLFRDRRSVAQQFWIRLGSSSNIVEATHSHYTLSPKSYILPKMHCRSRHCLELLHLFAHHCQHGRSNSQHTLPPPVGRHVYPSPFPVCKMVMIITTYQTVFSNLKICRLGL